MRKLQVIFICFFIALAGIPLLGSTLSSAEEKTIPHPFAHSGIFLKLTEDFYRALQEESREGTRTYGTDRSDEYLREIAVSAKFMVETNLHILKQQETIIRLLEALNSKRK